MVALIIFTILLVMFCQPLKEWITLRLNNMLQLSGAGAAADNVNVCDTNAYDIPAKKPVN